MKYFKNKFCWYEAKTNSHGKIEAYVFFDKLHVKNTQFLMLFLSQFSIFKSESNSAILELHCEFIASQFQISNLKETAKYTKPIVIAKKNV